MDISWPNPTRIEVQRFEMVLNLCESLEDFGRNIDCEKQSQVVPLIIEGTVYQVIGKLVNTIQILRGAHQRL